jgi:hypothetical protein
MYSIRVPRAPCDLRKGRLGLSINKYCDIVSVPQCVTEVRVSPHTANRGLYVARQERSGKIVPSRCGGGKTITWIPQVMAQVVLSPCEAIIYGLACGVTCSHKMRYGKLIYIFEFVISLSRQVRTRRNDGKPLVCPRY